MRAIALHHIHFTSKIPIELRHIVPVLVHNGAAVSVDRGNNNPEQMRLQFEEKSLPVQQVQLEFH